MQWEWLVPVAVVFFWIVGSLIQGVEKERARMNRPRLPGGDRPPGERSPRRPATDIDRFLEEVNRRRRQAAERRPVPSGREKPAAPVLGPAAPTARPRGSTRPGSGRPAVQVPSVPPSSGRILDALPATDNTAAAEILAVASALHAPPSPSFPTETVPTSRSGNAVVENAPSLLPPLVELLRTEDNLRTAVILHEILGPPRSRRPGIR
jgi:hypothetical protein